MGCDGSARKTPASAATVSAQMEQWRSLATSGKGIAGGEEGTGGARWMVATTSARTDKEKWLGTAGVVVSEATRHAERVFGMPASWSPCALAPGGHTGLPNFVQSAELRSNSGFESLKGLEVAWVARSCPKQLLDRNLGGLLR